MGPNSIFKVLLFAYDNTSHQTPNSALFINHDLLLSLSLSFFLGMLGDYVNGLNFILVKSQGCRKEELFKSVKFILLLLLLLLMWDIISTNPHEFLN